MKWNDGRFWGFFDEIAQQENQSEKIKVTSRKLEQMSGEDRAEIAGLMEEHMAALSKEPIYQVLVELNKGNPISEEGYQGCLAGIISNGHDFYEEVMERPACLRETYPELEQLCLHELIRLI